MSEAAAGKQAFSESGLGCASCHGDLAQGNRGPSLAGGRELEEFRHVHGHGLFPAKIVTDRDFAAINAWLQTLPRSRRDGDDG
jgi:mono/diheme cytochrome c family protein